MNQSKKRRRLSFIDALRVYHKHVVSGMENVPKKGRVLVVVNHSLATYDIGLLIGAIHEETGRKARPLGDRLLFKIPYLKDYMKSLGVVEGDVNTATDLLSKEELVTVAPGGMRESLRPSSQRYQIMWEKRKGFAKLAIETQTPVLLAMCPKADDIFEVYPNKLTSWAYKNFKIPLFLARGFGPTLIPKPIPLKHYLSECVVPPKLKKTAVHPLQVYHFHKKLIKISNDLIEQALSST